MRIVSRLWGDDEEEVEEELSPRGSLGQNDKCNSLKFVVVLSKSQKKKLRQRKNKSSKTDLNNARSRAGPRNYA